MSETLEPQTFRVTRADLVRYAGASGDFNPIHWSDRVATGVGLPGVIAHGMFTMALVGRAVTTWAGAGDAVVEFGVRFSKPVPVPDTDEGTEVVVSATIKEVTSEGHTRLSLTATCNGDKVLSLAQALIRKR
ncbi:MaoC/PaaZ C-terminal domain-containing protein [Actinoplanes derwentensis]|uniref:Acyl dehydratase n=1 Tax=Actinoplanes derwentensis TaxID=113562 RepID=A0A1H2CLS7_9ACTN|nr:MaoC/PaaZ C-terminal domain-containing protein [Actinoplanes derwentensis]GID82776.1 MaoC family dehydratase [Actinoplanes derwentensis]SDT71391.1 Acyl dehydratase [Actinoplanes derwentensis]